MFKPQAYAKTNFVAKNITNRALEEFGIKLKWKPNASVVDIGTGPGNILVENVLPRIANVKKAIGMDISSEVVKYAREKYSNVPNLKFISGDIQDEKKSQEYENHFDHATALYCLMLIPDQQKALQNIFKILKPGGNSLFLLVVDTPIYDAFNQLSKEGKYKNYLNENFVSPYHGLTYPIIKMETLLRIAGFSDCEAILHEDFIRENEGVFKEFIKSLPMTNNMPEELKPKFYEQILQILKKQGHFSDGVFEVAIKTMSVFATK